MPFRPGQSSAALSGFNPLAQEAALLWEGDRVGEVTVAAAGGTITSWTDRVAGYAMAQASVADRPITGRTINGVVVLDCVSTDFLLALTNLSTVLGAPGQWEIDVIYQADTLDEAGTGFDAPGLFSAGVSSPRLALSVGAGGVYATHFTGSATPVAISGSVPVTGTTYRARGYYDGTSLYAKNGSGAVGTPVTAAAQHTDNYAFGGATGKVPGGDSFDGAIAAILVYTRVKTTDERGLWDTYFANKYGAQV